MTGAVTLGRVRGIPIRAHFTLLIVLPYVAWVMAAHFAEVARGAGVSPALIRTPPVVLGLGLALSLFACVLAHELGHALVAIRKGGSVGSITLMLLGGVTQLTGLSKSARVEGLVAVAGPLVSAALGLAAWGLHSLGAGPPELRFALFYLAQMNLALAIFNLLPAFPMDGGRVLRAVLCAWLPREKATRVAAGTGSVFAAAFIVFGFASGNLLLGLIGLFVLAGARAEVAQAKQERDLRGLVVRDVMNPVRASVEAWESVRAAAERMIAVHATTLPVTEGRSLAGVVSLHHLERMSPQEREMTPVSAIVQRDAPRLHAGEALSTALERMAERDVLEAPVLEEGEVVGVLEPGDMGKVLRLRRLAEQADAEPARGFSGDRPDAPALPRDADQPSP